VHRWNNHFRHDCGVNIIMPHCRNNSKFKHKNRRKRQKWYPNHTDTWPLPFITWYRHFNKKTFEYTKGVIKKCCGVKLGVCGHTSPLIEIMRSYKCLQHASNMPTLTHYRADNIIIKNVYFILKFISSIDILLITYRKFCKFKICVS
jgi:hypothetical protein